MTTDDEQDILRAMLVMAAAGLDAMTKQLIRDALPTLVKILPKAKKALETFIQRQITAGSESSYSATGAKFLARVLAAESQQAQVIEEYIQRLTRGSLQSAEELLITANALGLDGAKCGIERVAVKAAFDVRNKIVHELDMDPSGRRRKRVLRAQAAMTKHADLLVGIGQSLLVEVSGALGGSGAAAPAC